MSNNSNLELARNSSSELSKVFLEQMLDTLFGKLSFGLFNAAMKTRNQFITEQLLLKLKNSQLQIDDELIQSNEFIGYTSKVLLALNTSTKKTKIDYLLNVYINGISDINFYDRSERYSELVDVISSLSEESIIILVEIYKDYNIHNKVEDNSNVLRLIDRLQIDYKDFISNCYLLSGKGLLRQVPLANGSFFPVPTSWLESIINLLQIDDNQQP